MTTSAPAQPTAQPVPYAGTATCEHRVSEARAVGDRLLGAPTLRCTERASWVHAHQEDWRMTEPVTLYTYLCPWHSAARG